MVTDLYQGIVPRYKSTAKRPRAKRRIYSGIIHETDHLVCIVTRSHNRKTGPGLQIWIIDKRMHPSDSRRKGFDRRNQCRGCPMSSYRGCYVMDMPIISIWRKFKRGEYPYLEMFTPQWAEFFNGHYVRFGAYGNPSILPLGMLADITFRAKRTTGYFHDWNLMPAEKAKAYGRFLMASTTPQNYAQAKAIGLRTFTTGSGELSEFGVECPSERGITCGECGICNGTSSGKKNDIWIKPHGYQANHIQGYLAEQN